MMADPTPPRGAYPAGTTFSSDLRRFGMRVEQQTQEIFVGVVSEAARSIIEGSELTGAPGQVVADVNGGNLRSSWQTTFESPTVALISTNVEYAESNEDGIARPGGGPYIQRSAIGGRHSVSKTIDGIDRIVDAEIVRVTEGRGR